MTEVLQAVCVPVSRHWCLQTGAVHTVRAVFASRSFRVCLSRASHEPRAPPPTMLLQHPRAAAGCLRRGAPRQLPVTQHSRACGSCSAPRQAGSVARARNAMRMSCMRGGGTAFDAARSSSIARLRSTPASSPTSTPTSASSSSAPAAAQQGTGMRVVCVGGGPVGLALSAALAQGCGCRVELHDSRPAPSAAQHAAGGGGLVALGACTLAALRGRHMPRALHRRRHAPPISRAASVLHAGKRGLQALQQLGLPAVRSQDTGASSANSGGDARLPPGLTLLQGLVVVAPDALRQERYVSKASRSKAGAGASGSMGSIDSDAVFSGTTAGIGACDTALAGARVRQLASLMPPPPNCARPSACSRPALCAACVPARSGRAGGQPRSAPAGGRPACVAGRARSSRRRGAASTPSPDPARRRQCQCQRQRQRQRQCSTAGSRRKGC
jgi:hypothetical protein